MDSTKTTGEKLLDRLLSSDSIFDLSHSNQMFRGSEKCICLIIYPGLRSAGFPIRPGKLK